MYIAELFGRIEFGIDLRICTILNSALRVDIVRYAGLSFKFREESVFF